MNFRLTQKTLKDKDGKVKGMQNRIIVESMIGLSLEEQSVIDSYVRNGYKLMVSTKGKTKTAGKGMTAEKLLQYFYNTKKDKFATMLKNDILANKNFMKICSDLKNDKNRAEADKLNFTDEMEKEICNVSPSEEVKEEIKQLKEKRKQTSEVKPKAETTAEQ